MHRGGARTPFGLRKQARLLLPLVGTWLAAVIALTMAGTQQSAPLRDLFLDASYLGGQPWYSGLLNEVSIMAWACAGTAAAFGSWVARLIGRRGAALFLAGGAVVALVFLVDVWIQFHSAVAPMLGIPSQAAEMGQAALPLLWAAVAWKEIARTRWLVLISAFAALGVSANVDWLFHPEGSWGLILEDGARLLGVLTFTHYMVLTTIDIIRSLLRQRSSADAPVPVPVEASVSEIAEQDLEDDAAGAAEAAGEASGSRIPPQRAPQAEAATGSRAEAATDSAR